MRRTSFLLGTLAMNQTVFFEALGDALEKEGHRVAFLCFHERSHEYLAARGRRSFNAFREAPGADAAVDLSAYGWPSLNLVLSHEKAAFELTRSAPLVKKLRRYLAACESAFQSLDRPILVQELGGFLSNFASFYAARRHALDNIFIEPSFFRGRVFMLRNTFAASRIAGPRSTSVSDTVARYLDDALASQQAVIPVKDARHYRRPIRKLTDPYNARRLAQKAVDKYVLGKHEEFGHIGGHVARHARMWINHRLMSARYRPLPPEGHRFIYYPLHVPADVALTIRSPQYVDQLALVDYLARIVPETHEVLIKEHPALVGAMSRERLRHLLETRDNVRLLDPAINNYEVLHRADAVVTVNSKSGAEALLLGRPVLVLGDAFYSECKLVQRVQSPAALPARLAATLAAQVELDPDAVRRYFQDVWETSWPGELHIPEGANADAFATSLLAFVEH
jgi:Capsule polysaccharide biosynthesis protein